MDMAKEKFDIIILAGQSNAEGYGAGSAGNVALSDKVYWLEAEKTVKIVKDKKFGENWLIEYAEKPFSIVKAREHIEKKQLRANFSITFADLYEKKYLQKGRKILVIRAAVGGTGLFKGQWGVDKQLYSKMLEMVNYALMLNPGNRLVAFLWHQGEHEAVEKNPPQVYEQQLSKMLSELRVRFGKIPFIAGDFCHDWTDRHLKEIKPISNVIKNVFISFGGAFVESDGLSSNDEETINADIIHFSRKAQYELGRRYFAEFEKLTHN